MLQHIIGLAVAILTLFIKYMNGKMIFLAFELV